MAPAAPKVTIPLTADPEKDDPEEGMALALSGGGYRAMVFHIGALWRLNESGWLPKLKRISSVSGGSITSALLGLKWPKLGFGPDGVAANFVQEVVTPLRRLASKTIDVKAILTGLLWFGTIAEKVANAYREHLFGKATLQDLPDNPRFVFNATNVQTGALWRFSKPYMGDWQVGLTPNPGTELAVAVGASSAFPPVLSPVVLNLKGVIFAPAAGAALQMPPYTERVVLNDGGVYDNLGLETIWKRYKTILVSDAGGKMPPEPLPKEDWVRHSVRVMEVIDNQVRSLRKRQLIESFKSGVRTGTYWGVRTNIQDYGLPDAIPCSFERTTELANTPTRLAAMADELQERLINWGYAVCDAALRKHVDTGLRTPKGLPFSGRGT